jgi:competence ComEA-like helix-hairpin-helix protein
MFSTNYITKAALVFGAAAGLAAAQDALPEGRGKAEFTRICSQCHSTTIVTKQRNSEDGWSGVVDDMVSRGAQGTDDEFNRVVKYLAANFGPNSPSTGSKAATTAAKVNVNQASEKDLSTILGLTATDAQAIVHYRDTNGKFKNWQDLEKVPNIDTAKLAGEKDRIEF